MRVHEGGDCLCEYLRLVKAEVAGGFFGMEVKG